MGEVRVDNPGIQALIRRYWWVIVLVLAVLGFLCAVIGPGLFSVTPIPEPTEAVTQAPPGDQPTETVALTEEATPTEKATETEEATPTEESTPTDEPTEPPVYVCVVDPNDGYCAIGCENTDLDSNACKCDFDNVCDKQEGFNCPDCSFGQCGNACNTDKDCKNPYLTCNSGFCGGDTCPAPPGPKCEYNSQCSNVQYPSYPDTDCFILCPGGGKVKDPYCNLYNQSCGQ